MYNNYHVDTGPCQTVIKSLLVLFHSVSFTLNMPRARLSFADVLHRGVVLSLVGVCVWGIGTGILVHRDTLRMGRGSGSGFASSAEF